MSTVSQLFLAFAYHAHSRKFLGFGGISSTVAYRYRKSTSLNEIYSVDNIDFLAYQTRKYRSSV